MKLKDKFFKKKKGKIIFSDEVIILEISETDEDKEKIFQKIDSNTNNTIKKLEIYSSKLKKFSEIIISIEEFYFQKTDIEILEDEVSEENLEKYMEYSAREFLEERNLDEYFIKYFKKEDNIYTLYIFERNFIEEIIEFSLRNSLKIEKIIIDSEEKLVIDNYDVLLKKDRDLKIDKRVLLIVLMIFIFFLIVKIYDFKTENEINETVKKIIVSEEQFNKMKLEQDNLEKEILQLKEKIKNLSMEKKYFSRKILRIFQMIPENIVLESIYYEKDNINIKGSSSEEEYLFEFLEILEKDREISECRYDYIIKKENFYEFVLELKV